LDLGQTQDTVPHFDTRDEIARTGITGTSSVSESVGASEALNKASRSDRKSLAVIQKLPNASVDKTLIYMLARRQKK
jgi:hypothetical protein